jgi:hypothetical protein
MVLWPWLSGVGLREVSNVTPNCFVIISRDATGNNREQGGDPFTVAVRGWPGGAGGVDINIYDNGDGTYMCGFFLKPFSENSSWNTPELRRVR